MKLPLAVDVLGFFFTFYALGFQTIVCMMLGYSPRRRSQRSVFNWLVVGFVAGLIPMVGLVFMVVAYFFYPPPHAGRGPATTLRGTPTGRAPTGER